MISFPMNSVLIINLIVVILILFALIIGYFSGFIKQVTDLIVLILSILVAWSTSNLLSNSIPLLSRHLNIFDDVIFGQYIYEITNSIVWFFIILLLFIIGIHQSLKPVVKQIYLIKWMKQVDKLMGSIVALIPQLIWILILMIIGLSPIFTNGQSTLEATVLKPLVPVGKSLSDTFIGQVDPYGIVIKLTNNDTLSKEDILNIPIWLEEFGAPKESVMIVNKIIKGETFSDTEINLVQTYLDQNEVSVAKARGFLEWVGLSQVEIDDVIKKFNFKQ